MRFLIGVPALLWLAAAALNSGTLAAVAAVAAIAGCCATALRSRSGPTLRMLIAGIAVAIAAFLLICIHADFTGAAGFYVQLLFLAILAPLMPLAYALTLNDRDSRD